MNKFLMDKDGHLSRNPDYEVESALTDKERLVLIEYLAKIKDHGDSKTIEMDFDEWCWLMDLAEEALDNK
jgi:hypothetical protein